MFLHLSKIPPSGIVTVITLNLILLFTTLIYARYHDHTIKVAKVVIGSEYPFVLPRVVVTMEDTEKYPIYGPQANSEWAATTPTANGYFHVGDDHRFVALAFGHEMHCMRVLRMTIAYPLHRVAKPEHVGHCLNYLRMSILCNPDLTLEKFDPLEGNFTHDTLGATHTCRDWQVMYEELSTAKTEWNDFRVQNTTSSTAL